MKKQELIKMLNQEQDKLWEALKNSETVFGVEHEATKMYSYRINNHLVMCDKHTSGIRHKDGEYTIRKADLRT